MSYPQKEGFRKRKNPETTILSTFPLLLLQIKQQISERQQGGPELITSEEGSLKFIGINLDFQPFTEIKKRT
jgi:hypothetical protein